MKWADFDSKFEMETKQRPVPNYVLVHLGANDLVNVNTKELIENIKSSFLRIKALTPSVDIIWSDMLPRLYWYGTLRPKVIEKARKRVNCAIRSFIKQEHQFTLRHPEITAKNFNLFRHDGTHLSPLGLGLYLNTIQGGLETFVLRKGSTFPPE